MTTEPNTTLPPLNTNGADFALKLVKLLKRLIQCMSQETLALQSHNRDVANQMSQEKTLLMHNYMAVQSELKHNPELLNKIDTDIHKHLKSVMGEFEQVMNDNIMAIQTGRNAVTRLINRIMKKARDAATASHKHYNAKGQMVEGNLKSGAIPTKINETY